MQFVRQSKFRHVYCKPWKAEQLVSDVRISKISWDSLFASVNCKFVAIIIEGAGGPFTVYPITKIGRIEKDYPIIDAHKAPCLEIAFCPYDDNRIASCSEDTTAKIWSIPDGPLRRNITEPLMELRGHQKRCTGVLWHPTAEDVLLTIGGDNKLLIWNSATGEALIEIAGHPDMIWSCSFNYNGSRIVTTCKDKKIRVIDPRSGAILQQGAGHEGIKPQQALYTKEGRIVTTGFSRRSERLYALRDEANLGEPIVQEELDTSNGVLFPLYDPDSGLLYLAGKGDCSIRYYEVNNEAPFIHYINTHTMTEPQRGLGFAPKMALSINENEIARIYKFTNKGLVEVLPFYVPRKSELFQEDLYPDTPGTKPALSAEDWLNGEDKDPVLVPVNPNTVGAFGEGANKDVEVAPKLHVRRSNIAQVPKKSPEAQQMMPEPSQTNAPPPKISMSMKTVTPKEKYEPAVATDGIFTRKESPRAITPPREKTPPAKIATQRVQPKAASPPPPSNQEEARWKARMERLARNDRPEPTAPSTATTTSRTLERNISTTSSVPPPPAEINWAQLVEDIHKMKLLIRKHERRIKFLEEALAERELAEDPF